MVYVSLHKVINRKNLEILQKYSKRMYLRNYNKLGAYERSS